MLGIENSFLASRHDIRVLNLTREDMGAMGAAGLLTRSNLTRTLADARLVFAAAKGTDIVHIHTALVPGVTLLRAAMLALSGRLRAKAVLVHVHSGKVQLWLNSRRRRVLARAGLRPASKTVAVSEGAHRALAEVIPTERLVLVENGVDPALYSSPTRRNDPPQILYVGLLTPRKGVVDLIEASGRLQQRGIAHELVIAGGTPDEGLEEEWKVRAAAEGKATLLGPRPHDEMPEVYSQADIFCLPSWWEAMPLTVLEAMASSLPVVATSVGDIPRMIEDGRSGRLVPPRDPAALAEAIAELITDPASAEVMGRAARDRVEALFASRRSLEALDKLYRLHGS